jgi:hypothetical protein
MPAHEETAAGCAAAVVASGACGQFVFTCTPLPASSVAFVEVVLLELE